jgi:uncharacterized protein (TIGR02453 family)
MLYLCKSYIAKIQKEQYRMADHNIERQQIFSFIENLIKNNNRDWFQAHKNEYDIMRENLDSFVQKLAMHLAKIEPSFKYTKSTDYTFRIYRDVRFSKDKSPYKNHIGIYLINGGRKSYYAGYYVHIQPNASFIAGGLFRPQPKILRAVRDEIYYSLKEFEKVVLNSDFKNTFGNLWGEDKLKRVPRDFPKDSSAAEYLKFKSFIAMRTFSDEEFIRDGFIETCMNTFRMIKPLNDFLNNAIALSQED